MKTSEFQIFEENIWKNVFWKSWKYILGHSKNGTYLSLKLLSDSDRCNEILYLHHHGAYVFIFYLH